GPPAAAPPRRTIPRASWCPAPPGARTGREKWIVDPRRGQTMRTASHVRWAAAVAAGVAAVLLPGSAGTGQGPGGRPAFVFRDVGDETGAFPDLAGIRGHGAALGHGAGPGGPGHLLTAFPH